MPRTLSLLPVVPFLLVLVACSSQSVDETPPPGSNGAGRTPSTAGTGEAGKGAAPGGGGAAGATEDQTCVPAGTWVLSYTLDASSDALCEALPDEVSEERGDGSPGKTECDASCTCEGAITGFPTCGGKRTMRCDDGDSKTTTTLELTRKSTTSYEGKTVIEKVLPQIQLRCAYAIRFARK